jgi:hypothetical protein
MSMREPCLSEVESWLEQNAFAHPPSLLFARAFNSAKRSVIWPGQRSSGRQVALILECEADEAASVMKEEIIFLVRLFGQLMTLQKWCGSTRISC